MSAGTSHLCYEHPDGKKWADGSVSGCPYHEHNRAAPRVRMGRKERAALDKAAGVVGREGDGYIHGGNDVGDFKRPARTTNRRKYL